MKYAASFAGMCLSPETTIFYVRLYSKVNVRNDERWKAQAEEILGRDGYSPDLQDAAIQTVR